MMKYYWDIFFLGMLLPSGGLNDWDWMVRLLEAGTVCPTEETWKLSRSTFETLHFHGLVETVEQFLICLWAFLSDKSIRSESNHPPLGSGISVSSRSDAYHNHRGNIFFGSLYKSYPIPFGACGRGVCVLHPTVAKWHFSSASRDEFRCVPPEPWLGWLPSYFTFNWHLFVIPKDFQGINFLFAFRTPSISKVARKYLWNTETTIKVVSRWISLTLGTFIPSVFIYFFVFVVTNARFAGVILGTWQKENVRPRMRRPARK